MRYTVKAKLGTAFGVVIVLSMVSGGLAITKLSTMNDTVETLVSNQAKRLELTQEMKIHALANIRAEKNMILSSSDEETNRYAAEALRERELVRASREATAALATEAGRKMLDRYAAIMTRHAEIQDKMIALAKQNSSSRAREIYLKEARPAFDETRVAFARLTEHLDRIAPADRTAAVAGLERLQLASEQVWGTFSSVLSVRTVAGMERDAKAASDGLEALRRQRDALRDTFGAIGAAAAYGQFSEQIDRWVRAQERVIATARQAGTILAEELSTGEARQAVVEAGTVLDEYMTRVQGQMEEAKKEAAATYESARMILLSVVALSLMIAIGAALWIAISISRGLGRAVGLANAVAIGDLSQKVDIATNDEIKDLVDAMNRMTDSLNATAKVADEIAAGNLTVSAKRLSDKDTLGIALETMLEKLRGIVAEAATAAQNVSSVHHLPERDPGFVRPGGRVHPRLDLAHELLGAPARLAEAHAVAAVDLHADGPDVPAVAAHVALDRVGPRRAVADHHQAPDLLVAVNARAERQVPDARLGEVQDGHLSAPRRGRRPGPRPGPRPPRLGGGRGRPSARRPRRARAGARRCAPGARRPDPGPGRAPCRAGGRWASCGLPCSPREYRVEHRAAVTHGRPGIGHDVA